MSLDIKEVIQIARAQFKELMPDLSMEGSDVRLEEIERIGKDWAITFSVPNQNFNMGAALLVGIANARYGARIAKVIVVDGEDGQLVALRERAA
jgi:hypothetical protein